MKPDWDHPAISETDGPSANGDPMGTPARSERVLWKGRPSLPVLTRTAFHMGSFAAYFAVLIVLAIVFGNTAGAMFLVGAGLFGAVVIQLIAWRSAKSTLYIITDVRLIMRIGMAVETRINIPLKHIEAADLNMRGRDHGDIALRLGGERLLGYMLMWPHVRPWHFSRPQPMLRALPDPQAVAKILADACAQHAPVEQNLSEVNAVNSDAGKPDFEGAPA